MLRSTSDLYIDTDFVDVYYEIPENSKSSDIVLQRLAKTEDVHIGQLL